MIIQVVCHAKCKPLHFIHDDLELLWREVDEDSEAGLSAVLDTKLLNTLLYAMLGVHEVDYFIAQVLSLITTIALVL